MTISEPQLAEDVSSKRQPPSKASVVLLLLLTIYTCLVMAGLLIPYADALHDNFGIGLDVIQVGSLAAVASALVLWCLWVSIFSGWNWLHRVLFCAVLLGTPYAAVKVLRPVLGGDANVIRWEPIWATSPESPTSTVAVEPQVVDLLTESPTDFARFLGPKMDASVPDAVDISVENFEKAKVLWRQPIGLGWSAFAVRNGYAVTMEQREEFECVTCYSVASGKLLWIYKHEARHSDSMGMGRTGPRSTPTIAAGNVYALGALGNLVCLNGADGSVLWQENLRKRVGGVLVESKDRAGFQCAYEDSLSWGRSASMLVHDGKVIVPGGGAKDGDKQTLLAFDAESGEFLWSGGKEMISYGSPSVATVSGVEQILLTAENSVMGFDPANGDVLWQMSRPGDSRSAANTSQVSVVSDSTILTSKGYPDGGGELIRISFEGGQSKAAFLWKNKLVLKTKLTSPVIFEGHSYCLSNGFLECVRLKDGKRIWKRRGRFGHGQMLLVRDKILLNTEDGKLLLIKASSTGYEQLAALKSTVSGTCWNCLAMSGDKLLVRSELEATCLQIPTR